MAGNQSVTATSSRHPSWPWVIVGAIVAVSLVVIVSVVLLSAGDSTDEDDQQAKRNPETSTTSTPVETNPDPQLPTGANLLELATVTSENLVNGVNAGRKDPERVDEYIDVFVIDPNGASAELLRDQADGARAQFLSYGQDAGTVQLIEVTASDEATANTPLDFNDIELRGTFTRLGTETNYDANRNAYVTRTVRYTDELVWSKKVFPQFDDAIGWSLTDEGGQISSEVVNETLRPL